VKAANRHHLPTPWFGGWPVAADGAPYYNWVPPTLLIRTQRLVLDLPPNWVMTERPQFVKGKGWVSVAAPNG